MADIEKKHGSISSNRSHLIKMQPSNRGNTCEFLSRLGRTVITTRGSMHNEQPTAQGGFKQSSSAGKARAALEGVWYDEELSVSKEFVGNESNVPLHQ